MSPTHSQTPLKTLLTSLFILLCMVGKAQYQLEEDPMQNRHFASFTFAYGVVPKGADEDNLNHKNHLVPSLGADYLYRLAPQWELGIMVDWELARYIIPHKEELIRDHAFIATIVGAYNVTSSWSVFGGGGIEIEKHKSFAIWRLGTEYGFDLGNRWTLPIGVFMDVKEGYENYSFSIGVGRAF